MAEHEDDAARWVDQILAGQAEEPPEGPYISDLLWHAREFAIETDILSSLESRFPCAVKDDGSRTPLALWPGVPIAAFVRHLPRLMEGSREDIALLPLEEAQGIFRSGMVAFLSSRLRSFFERDAPGERVALQLPAISGFGFGLRRLNTSGFRVSVSAQTPGLRIHSSPTFRRKWSFFGHPTSPASGTLPGGTYEFGADGGPYAAITPDQASFDIPYKTTSPVLLL